MAISEASQQNNETDAEQQELSEEFEEELDLELEEESKSLTPKELRSLDKQGLLVIGTNTVLKGLKTSKLSKVLIAKNCPEIVKNRVLQYAKLQEVEVIELEWDNEALGSACRKPFTINVVGVKK